MLHESVKSVIFFVEQLAIHIFNEVHISDVAKIGIITLAWTSKSYCRFNPAITWSFIWFACNKLALQSCREKKKRNL